MLGRSFAVLGVKVPALTNGLVAIHQQPGLAPHLAIEELHRQSLAIVSPFGKLGDRADEAVVGQDFDRARKLVVPFVHRRPHPPFARLDHADATGCVALDRAGDLAGETPGIFRIVERHVIDGPAFTPQRRGEVAHGREDQDDLLLVVLDVSRLLPNLHHQDHGLLGRRLSQGRKSARKLIAEDGNEGGWWLAHQTKL